MMTKTRNKEQTYASACQQLNEIANLSRNWLVKRLSKPVEMVRHEKGILRSIRMAQVDTVSDEVTQQSYLQLVLLPETFDAVRFHGTEHPRWQLLVYSWLDMADTQSLKTYLEGKIGCEQTFWLKVTTPINSRIDHERD